MSVTLEKIDELRKRTNCSYEEAKILLEKHNGDIVEAIVEFEKSNHSKSRQHHKNESASSFGTKLKSWIDKGFKTKFIIEKSGETIVNIPVNILILAALFLNWVLFAALVISLFFGFKFSIKKQSGEIIDINKMVNNFGINTNDQPTAKKPETKNDVVKKDEDKDYNEFTVE